MRAASLPRQNESENETIVISHHLFCGEKESQGIGDTSFLLGLMLSSEVHKQRGERTALQADRLYAVGGEIRDIMNVTEIRIPQNKKSRPCAFFCAVPPSQNP